MKENIKHIESPEGKSIFEQIKPFLRYAVAAVLIVILSASIDFAKILLALKNADYLLIALSLILCIPNVYLQYLKWKIICNFMLKEYSRKRIMMSLFYGLSAGAITPMRLGEYVGRSMALKDTHLVKVTTATVIDKIFLMIVTYVAGSVSTIVFLAKFYGLHSQYVLLLTGAAALAIAVLAYTLFSRKGIMGRLLTGFERRLYRTAPFMSKYIEHYFPGGLSVFRGIDRNIRIKLSLVSFLFYGCILLQYSLLAAAFSHLWFPLEFLLAGNLVIFSKTLLPFSFGDLGIREGASVFFLSHMGLTAAVGFNASIFLFFLNIFIPSAIGSLLLMKGNK